MEISQAELERRLSSSKNLANSVPASQPPKINIQPIQPINKPEPKKHLDPITRTVAAVLKNSGDLDSLKDLNIKPGQIKSSQNSPKIAGAVSAGTERVRELALDKLMSALGLMTEEKFENASLRELSGVARDMSRVVESTSEKSAENNRLQIIINAPSQKTEDSYRVIDV